MCDTFVALADATVDGSVVFGKNSDREPNEAHEVVLEPASAHAPGSQVTCTYRSVPQVARTNAVALSKPYWIWGAEMGVNEYGVAMGNEAVFTKVPHEPEQGLIGMDLLRLALERADSAGAALRVVTDLLEEYGQGGNAGHTHRLRYHNSFLIADPEEAWVLETAGRDWAAQRVRSFRSISNALTIGASWDLASDGLVERAVERGWCKDRESFHFAGCYSDHVYTRLSAAAARQCRTTALLAAGRGRVTPTLAMRVLRDHGGRDADPAWTPARGLLGQDVCAHAGYGPVRGAQSTGSMVAHLTPEPLGSAGSPTMWMTATSAPCTSVFKPVWLDGGLPYLGPLPTGTYDPSTLWWRHEDLHRSTLVDYGPRLAAYAGERDALEESFEEAAAAVAAPGASAHDRAACTAWCFEQAEAMAKRWLDEVRATPVRRHRGRGHGGNRALHARAWAGWDARAGRPPV